jgi:hypothetical protein
MNALIAGIAAFFLAALGTVCPHDVIYVPSLLVIIIAGGFVGGTIFSLQSEGVYDLRIRVHRSAAASGETKLAGIWAYGLVGIPAGTMALLIGARLIGVDDAALATALTSRDGVAGALHRVATCLGVFAATVVGGFLGLNLIRVVSERLKAEIHREVKGQVAPIHLFTKGKLLMDEHAYEQSLEAFRALAREESSLRPIVWQARALKRLGRLNDAVAVLDEGLKTRGPSDEPFRRAVAYWNRACYKCLNGGGNDAPQTVRSIVEDLRRAVHDAPGFVESLSSSALDPDLVSLVGHPIFEAWRHEALGRKGSEHER